jgi:hypothetical protein
MLQLPTRVNRNAQLLQFAEELQAIQDTVPFKMSARGWCYLLETRRLINKDGFDRCENVINECREKGYLPVDFVAEDSGRDFHGVEEPDAESADDYMISWINSTLNAGGNFTPDWWAGEQYYIQMLVEKIDLRTLFEPVCAQYKIPIATAKGWSSILQRAEYARRFKEAEDNGKTCVLLYCGDHDPPGIRISDFIMKNLADISEIVWSDGTEGYDPAELIIERFGLNYDFIKANHLTSIDNLLTGSGKNLASKSHPDNAQAYVQDYIAAYGVRKWEANSIVAAAEKGQQMCREAIEKYLGQDALQRFKKRRQDTIKRFEDLTSRNTEVGEHLLDALDLLENPPEKEEESDDTEEPTDGDGDSTN